MFKVVAEPRRRRISSPRTVAASVIFHLLVVVGIVAAAEDRHPVLEVLDDGFGLEPPETPRLVNPAPATPPDQPRIVKTQTVQLPTPPDGTRALPMIDPHLTRLTEADVTGIGRLGDVRGTPNPNPAPPIGDAESREGEGDSGLVIVEEAADVRPELVSRRQAEIILQNHYPPLLRDAGTTGRTTVELIIGADGRVQPGSVRVKESSNPAFNQAAIRAIERFRFTPAMYRGHPVAVLVTLPIEWQLAP